ncbi:hypothetical protein [Pseudotabrizicola formosa]|nr:hypothetical protein [Pseudotabrizicola formosa]
MKPSAGRDGVPREPVLLCGGFAVMSVAAALWSTAFGLYGTVIGVSQSP